MAERPREVCQRLWCHKQHYGSVCVITLSADFHTACLTGSGAWCLAVSTRLRFCAKLSYPGFIFMYTYETDNNVLNLLSAFPECQSIILTTMQVST